MFSQVGGYLWFHVLSGDGWVSLVPNPFQGSGMSEGWVCRVGGYIGGFLCMMGAYVWGLGKYIPTPLTLDIGGEWLCPGDGYPTHRHGIQWDTADKRVVRILLEYFLVYLYKHNIVDRKLSTIIINATQKVKLESSLPCFEPLCNTH